MKIILYEEDEVEIVVTLLEPFLSSSLNLMN